MPGIVIGIVYHLLKSSDFSNIKHVLFAALLTALAFCIRPDQALLTLTPVLIFAIGIAARKKLITATDVFLCFLVVILTAATFVAKVVSQAVTTFPTSGLAGAAFFLRLADGFFLITMAVLVASAPIVFTIARKTASTADGALFFALIICALPLIWFFPADNV